jgi:hypothetical protein
MDPRTLAVLQQARALRDAIHAITHSEVAGPAMSTEVVWQPDDQEEYNPWSDLPVAERVVLCCLSDQLAQAPWAIQALNGVHHSKMRHDL